MKKLAIGILDSGIGGFSVVKELKRLLPKENIEYFADHARQPYGVKKQKEIEGFVIQIINFLLEKGIKACIIACNTATSASLVRAKKEFNIPVIGVIKNGAKAAIEITRNGKIGLIGSEFTVNSRAHHKEIKRINPELEIFANPCPNFTPLIEMGQFETAETYRIAKEYLKPIKDAQVDTLILGCTHYPFLQKEISDVMGSEVRIINPAYNTVLDLKKILEEKHLLNPDGDRRENYYTTGNLDNMKKVYRIIFNSSEFNIKKVEI
ncbi:Glutamate racemase [subsurface metagenome]